jgi:hypothetical protein
VIRALARLFRTEPRKPVPIWYRVVVRYGTTGFRYRDRTTGEMRDAVPGETVVIDAETYAAVNRKVETV